MSVIIYQPKGKAREYSPWAANFYNGCSNRCDYCYNRHCQAKDLLGKDVPTLKKALIDEPTAIKIFFEELDKYKERILADGKGLFFNFVSDPMLEETRLLNLCCILEAIKKGVPCVILTKCADWWGDLEDVFESDDVKNMQLAKDMLKIGFTLTGCDEMEHTNKYSTNEHRMGVMRVLHEMGFKTWASIEPVIDIDKSLSIFRKIILYCDEYKIGLLSGKKSYTKDMVRSFVDDIHKSIDAYGYKGSVTFKESVFKFIEGSSI